MINYFFKYIGEKKVYKNYPIYKYRIKKNIYLY